MAANMNVPAIFKEVDQFRTCEQCGLCSSACPITGREGYNIRRILKHVELELTDEIANTPYAWMCTTCGRCESVCPNGIAILDIVRPLRALTAPQFTPPEGPPPCVRACPGGIDIPGYLRLIAQGKPQEACDLIMERVPLPGVLGRVCTHPCESECRRKDVNQAVSICALKRYAADQAGEPSPEVMQVAPDSGRKVAVVGSGPAGLSAAFFLRKKGHQVTIFEGREQAGGMLRYGIPAYRLPAEVLDREIGRILDLGIELKTSRRLGRDFDLDSLKKDGFDAVFLALGLQKSRRIDLPGADLEGVLWGLDFLTAVRGGQDVSLARRVVVIGGGNVAVDVALTARRLGAESVTMACLESEAEMPANPWEVEMAREEGVEILPSWGPARVLDSGGRVAGLELVRCTAVFDDQGRFAPSFDQSQTQSLEAEQIILAVGQASDLEGLAPELVDRGLVKVEDDSTQTAQEGVFAGGDAASGPGTVIGAIAQGKRAAAEMDRFLGGDGKVEPDWSQRKEPADYDGKREPFFADQGRVEHPCLPLDQRGDFAEVELCLEEAQARLEAGRCLQCDLERRLVSRIQASL